MRRTMITGVLVLAGVAAVAVAAALPAGAQGGRFVVVVHGDNPATSMTRGQVSRLLLKKITTWEDGTRVQPVDQDEDSQVREEFTAEVHDKSIPEVKAYWQRMIFSGRAVPPPVKGSDREVVAYVAATPGAIGYVSASADVRGVKVLRLEDR